MKKIITFLLLITATFLSAQVTLIPNTSVWKYKDDGSNQGTSWYGTGFNDASWASGAAELGYGDGDESTILNACGIVTQFPTCTNKYITAYFRQTFTVGSTASFTAYTASLRRDDGIILYVNGVEVYRNNMPTGTVTYTTPASTACSDDGATVFSTTISSSLIVTGTNVIAAELHQNVGTSSDLSFVLNLAGNTNTIATTIIKGPYLQVATPTSMLVRWETNVATDSKVMYGTNASSLSAITTNTAISVTHSVQLAGLIPYTKYYYNIGSSTMVTQGDTNNYFLTLPIPGTPGKYRFWVVSDCGNASTNQVNCKNAYKAYNGNKPTNGWLHAGDLVYTSGTNAEYNSSYFAIYQNDVMKNIPMFPAPGNHDYNNGASTATTVPYFSIFSTPAAGEAGGVPSNNPAYYSYDYGNIHFIALDSYGTTGASQKMYDTTGAQVLWLKADLAANTKPWIVAYWHHPPFTMGSHNSDTESDLANIRSKFIRILERNKVDLIITSHSHDYERSKLMNGHYGNEATFNATTHNLTTSSGLYNGTTNSCPYEKDSLVKKIGTVYVVTGSAGQLGGQQTSFPHDAMHYSNATNGGSCILDVEDNKLNLKWLCADGVIRDEFTMVKEVKKVQSYTVQPNQTVSLSASWPGSYIWSDASTNRTLTASSATSTSIWVKDPNNCLADTFKLNVLPAVSFSATAPFCVSSPVQFSDLSSNATTAWNWLVAPSTGVSISNANAQNPSIQFANSGTYTVTLNADNIYGSGTAYSQVVTINANPSVSITTTSGTLCANQNLTLNTSGANTYSWSTASTNASISISPSITTVYSVSGTDLNGCSAIDTKTVFVTPLPVITVAISPSTAVICLGGTLSLNAAGATTYTWSNAIGNGIAFTPSTSANYSVYGTDVNGCQSTAVVSVSVNPLPSLSIVSNPSNAIVCNGSSLSLNANGATSYSWSNGISNGVSFTPTTNATYTVMGTLNGCTNTATQMVVVNSLPNLSTGGNTVICSGQSASLTVSGATSYTWNTGATTASVTLSPTLTSTYTVVATGSNSCQNSSVRTITVNTLPLVTAISNPSNGVICMGGSLTLSGAGATSYSWSGGINNATAFSPTANASYTVTGTDANGCQNTAVKSVTVNALPTVSISGSSVICTGQSGTLSTTGANTYSWSTSSTNNSIVVNPTSTTLYSVTGTDNNGCTNTATRTLSVNPLPVITITNGQVCPGYSYVLNPTGALTYTYSSGSNTVTPTATGNYSITGTSSLGCVSSTPAIVTVSVVNNLLLTISGSSAVCLGQTKILTANGASSYTWNTGVQSNSLSISPTSNTSYTVLGATPNCSNTMVFSVLVNPLPTVSIVASQTAICLGKSTTLIANGATTYMWNTGSNNPTVTVSPQTNTSYTLTGYDMNGCLNTANQMINVNTLPSVNITSSNSLICVGESATLTANGAVNYVWNNNAATSSITISPLVSTTYIVTGTDNNNCSNMAQVSQKVNECTGLDDRSLLSTSVKVYPNPSAGEVFFEVNGELALDLRIYNVLGQSVVHLKVTKGIHLVNLDEVKGLYFYTLHEGARSIGSGKIVIE